MVGDALAPRGLPRRLMDLRAIGEDRPRVDTADGAREAKNRRVEISLDPAAAAASASLAAAP